MSTTTRALAQRSAVAALAVGAAFGLAACAGGGSGESSAGAAGEASLTIEEKEFTIALSEPTLSPGTYTLVVENAGTVDHALEIEGPGVGTSTINTIAPGASAKITITLANGSYQIYCPIDGHRASGMDLTIDVGGGGGTTTTPPKTTGGGYGSN